MKVDSRKLHGNVDDTELCNHFSNLSVDPRKPYDLTQSSQSLNKVSSETLNNGSSSSKISSDAERMEKRRPIRIFRVRLAPKVADLTHNLRRVRMQSTEKVFPDLMYFIRRDLRRQRTLDKAEEAAKAYDNTLTQLRGSHTITNFHIPSPSNKEENLMEANSPKIDCRCSFNSGHGCPDGGIQVIRPNNKESRNMDVLDGDFLNKFDSVMKINE
ncbi:hypothetical protein ACFE04_017987 [Oxalis oulophora]